MVVVVVVVAAAAAAAAEFLCDLSLHIKSANIVDECGPGFMRVNLQSPCGESNAIYADVNLRWLITVIYHYCNMRIKISQKVCKH